MLPITFVKLPIFNFLLSPILFGNPLGFEDFSSKRSRKEDRSSGVQYQPFVPHGNNSQLHICFHTNELNARGTTRAVYDYAHYNEILLGHKSIILCPDNNEVLMGEAVTNFVKRFGGVNTYSPSRRRRAGTRTLPRAAAHLNCSLLYIMKDGMISGVPSFPESFSCTIGPPTAIHGVFEWQRHGTSYAMISEEQVKGRALVAGRNVSNAWVPHIVEAPVLDRSVTGWRERLNIPDSALVICRHGGTTTFDLSFVQDLVCEMVHRYKESRLHFVFWATQKWNGDCTNNHRQVHFVEPSASAEDLEAYFATCDVELHARKSGEMFSMAIAEASVRNKPVLHFQGDGYPQPLMTRGSKGFLYDDKDTLRKYIVGFLTTGVPRRDYNAYREFSAENVMKRFHSILIEPALTKGYRATGHKMLREC